VEALNRYDGVEVPAEIAFILIFVVSFQLLLEYEEMVLVGLQLEQVSDISSTVYVFQSS
jgi:hypothetical protein